VIAGYATPAARRTASLVVNGRTIATRTVEVPAGGRATVEFPSLEAPYGFSRCEVRIDSADAFPADDGYLFSVERSDPERVLLVHSASDARSPRYFSDALNAAAESAFALQTVTVDQLPNQALSKYAFVVLSNVAGLPSAVESDLAGYVNRGGSVLVALGTSAAGRSRVPVLGAAIETVHDYPREFSRGREQFVSVAEADPSHASVGTPGNLNGVRFYYAVRVDPGNAHVAARLTDRTPLLLDKKVGEGRVLLFASGLDSLTNDFPLHPSFVAFVEQTARYLSGSERPHIARVVDSFLDLRTAQQSGADGGAKAGSAGGAAKAGGSPGVEVVDPDGHRPLSLNEAATAESLRLSRAGFYEVRMANGRQEVIGVNPDRRESNLEVVPDEALKLWRGSPTPSAPAALAGGGAPAQKEPYSLWWYIMMLVLLAALAESLLASRYLGTRREELLTQEAP
jgi:hypothetical protein